MGKGLWGIQSKMHSQWFWQLLASECSGSQSALQFTLNWYCLGRKRREDKSGLLSHRLRVTPMWIISRARICSASCWDMLSWVGGTHSSVSACRSALHPSHMTVTSVLAFQLFKKSFLNLRKALWRIPAAAITPWLGFNAALPAKGSLCCHCVSGVWSPAQPVNQAP